MSLELFVGLKIPDTTAITTFHVLERLGYKISKIKREIYYKFDVGDVDKFSKKVGKVDVLVNANKNKFSTELKKQEGAFYILVKDIDDSCEDLLTTLHKLGLNEIKSMEKGVLWTLFVDSEKIAKEIAEKLLYNKNYQEIEVL
jgi:phosphoribosylformylglycinamidine (FGAM) synthase PurS component